MENREVLVEVKFRIIAEVRQHPVIYDKAHKGHFKKNVKAPIFNGIAELLNQEFPQY